ncbi:hypothetical protein PoB_005714100 [Plakobranchus ocellatus]|uniref:Uncharacterized protein n=1 Tax=Plakobranchus ocellatus TaxID=259542 RepID=A0AAV4CD12_9GAST|nr:hypothetical protein PoB_005714100 [Plakobranchus ocellatus]
MRWRPERHRMTRFHVGKDMDGFQHSKGRREPFEATRSRCMPALIVCWCSLIGRVQVCSGGGACNAISPARLNSNYPQSFSSPQYFGRLPPLVLKPSLFSSSPDFLSPAEEGLSQWSEIG